MALRKHTLTHMDPSTVYKCTVCSKVFRSLTSLWSHRKIHHNPMQCETCGYIAMSKSVLARHAATHSLERHKYICDQCGQQFLTRYSLQTHIRTKHDHVRKQNGMHDPLFSPLFECKVCHKKYRTKCALKQHEEKHMGFVFTCEFCDKQFRSKWSLWKHLKGSRLCTKQLEESKKLKWGKDGCYKNFSKYADAACKTILVENLPVPEQE